MAIFPLSKTLTRIVLRVTTILFAGMYVALFILGIVVRSKKMTEFGLPIIGGIVGVVSSIFGFFGAGFNNENSGPFFKKLWSTFIIIFLIIQFILHVGLIFSGAILLKMRDIVDIMTVLSDRNFKDIADDLDDICLFTKHVGIYTIVVGALVACVILITIVHMGFDFFSQIYASSVSILHLAAAAFVFTLILTFIREYFILKFYLPYILEFIFLTLTGIVGLIVALKRFQVIAKWIEKPYYVIAIISVVGLVYVVGTVAHDRTNIEPYYDDLCVSGLQSNRDLCEKWTDRIGRLVCEERLPAGTPDVVFEMCVAARKADPAPIMDELAQDFNVVYKLVIFMTAYLLAFFVISTAISIAFYLLFSPSNQDSYGTAPGGYSESSSLLSGSKIGSESSTV